MIKALSILLFLILTIISALHLYWGFGGLWPATTEQELIHTVVGDPNMSQMFGLVPTLIVAGLIFTSGLIALAAGGIIRFGPKWLVRLLAASQALVFLGRGALGYYWNTLPMEIAEPFKTLNTLYYSPLILFIGVSFLLLTIKPRSS